MSDYRADPVALDEVVRALEPLLTRLAGDRVDLVLVLRDTTLVHAERAQLEEMVVNLVVNARDAMPDGGLVSIRTYSTTLSAGARPQRLGIAAGDYVALVVADNGVGMDDDVRSRAFEASFTTKPDAAGLGLTVVERTARGLGGAVELQSSPGGGTTVRILLPVATVG
jgi:signal transduction histidine kinase